MKLEDIYQEVILDHYKHPHGRGLREPFQAQVHHVNPTCGDEITLRLLLDDEKKNILDISYEGHGCSISQSAASVLNDQLTGVDIDTALNIVQAFQEMISSRGNIEGDEELLGDGIVFAGVSRYPARVKCALLSWMAFKDVLVQILESPESRDSQKPSLSPEKEVVHE